jgi:hypothetical protein
MNYVWAIPTGEFKELQKSGLILFRGDVSVMDQARVSN